MIGPTPEDCKRPAIDLAVQNARWQIFLRDPNNVEIELNFESKNETE